jgi:hypothetical protein
MRRFILVIPTLFLLAVAVPAQKAKPKPAKTPAPKTASAVAPVEGYGPPKISEIPLPCMLKMEDIPKMLGVRLDMPIDDAKKLYSRSLNADLAVQPSPELPNHAFYRVPFKPNKKEFGIPAQSVEFASILEKKVESMGVQFANKQTLSSEELFKKISGLLNMAPEVWLLVDHGNGMHMSWRAECSDFEAQFDAQKGLYYRLSLRKLFRRPPATPKTPPIGDGD